MTYIMLNIGQRGACPQICRFTITVEVSDIYFQRDCFQGYIKRRAKKRKEKEGQSKTGNHLIKSNQK